MKIGIDCCKSLVKITSEKNNKLTTELFVSGSEKSKRINKDPSSADITECLL